MSNSLIVAEALIIAPQTYYLVFSARNKVLPLSGDGKCVDLSFFTSVEHTDCFSVERGPVGDFFVGTCGEELGFFGVVDDGLLEVGFFDGVHTSEGLEIPYNPGSISGYGYCVLIVAFDLKRN